MKEKLIEQLEKLTGKKVILKEARVYGLKAGDVIELNGRHGKEKIVLLHSPSPSRTRATAQIVMYGQKNKYIDKYLNGTNEKLPVYTVKLSNFEDYNVIETIDKKQLEAIKGGYEGLRKPIDDKRRENEKTVHNALQYNFNHNRYELTLENGDVCAAGDRVNVQFSNGVFTMYLGNDKGMLGNLSGGNKSGGIFVRRNPGDKARTVIYKSVLSKVR